MSIVASAVGVQTCRHTPPHTVQKAECREAVGVDVGGGRLTGVTALRLPGRGAGGRRGGGG